MPHPGPHQETGRHMTINLKDRIALVTGASRGIGYFTALELAKAGAHVIACARTVGGLEELDDAIKAVGGTATLVPRSEEHTSELQSLMRISYAVFCLKKKKNKKYNNTTHHTQIVYRSPYISKQKHTHNLTDKYKNHK